MHQQGVDPNLEITFENLLNIGTDKFSAHCRKKYKSRPHLQKLWIATFYVGNVTRYIQRLVECQSRGSQTR